MCVWFVYICIGSAFTHVYMCGGQRPMFGVFLNCFSTDLKWGLLLNLELTDLARLVS